MKKKKMIGLVLAMGIATSGLVGFNALAQTGTGSTQTQNREQSFGRGCGMTGRFNGNFQDGLGGFMRNFGGRFNMHYGRGMMGGNGTAWNDLTEEQKTELDTIRNEIGQIMTENQDKMNDARGAFREAVASGDRASILTAWENLKSLRQELFDKMKSYRTRIAGLTGREYDENRVPGGYMDDIMEELAGADDARSQEIIESLQNGRGYGMMAGFSNRPGSFGCQRLFR